MTLKIECEIEVDETLWFNDDEENTMLILWSNEAGDEIGQTSNFKYTIL